MGIGIGVFSYSDAQNHALGANQASGFEDSIISDAQNHALGVNQASGFEDSIISDAKNHALGVNQASGLSNYQFPVPEIPL